MNESVEPILNESQREFLLTQNGPEDSPAASTEPESPQEPQKEHEKTHAN